MSNEKLDGKTVVDHLLAARQLEATASYVSRGRRFRDASIDQLQQLFVDAHRLWSADFTDRSAHLLTDDLSAEYQLREIPPPYDLVRPYIDAAAKAAAARIDALSEDQREAINDEMLADYSDMRGSES